MTQAEFNTMLQAAIAQGLPGGNYVSRWSGEEIDRRLGFAAAPVSGKNLLDNAYFPDPINQRRQKEYSGDLWIYTIDRWILSGSSGKLTIEDGCIKIENTADTPAFFFQKAELSDFNNLRGQTVTLSIVYKAEGTLASLYCGYIAPGSPELIGPYTNDFAFDGTWRLAQLSFEVPDEDAVEYQICGLSAYQGSTLWIKAAKVELGCQQTLAYQDAEGNWVLNDPQPDYALELLKCQRYQRAFLPGSIFGYSYKNTAGNFCIYSHVGPIRVRPVVESGATITFENGGGNIDSSKLSIASYDLMNGLIELRADVSAVSPAPKEGGAAYVYYNSPSPLFFNSNL